MLRCRARDSSAPTSSTASGSTLPAARRRACCRAAAPARLTRSHDLLPRRGTAAIAPSGALLRRIDAVVAHTEDGAGALRDAVGARSRAGPGHPARRPRLPDPAAATSARCRSELAAAEAPVILFFGLIRPYKGVDVLLEAFRDDRRAPSCGSSAAVGCRLETAARAAAARPRGTVRFVPRFVADPEIPACSAAPTWSSLPYREIEQSGVLYTALAFGKPIVLSDVGGFARGRRATARRGWSRPATRARSPARSRAARRRPAERDRLAAAARAAAAGPTPGTRSPRARSTLYRELLALSAGSR